jgi:hypothetical protein
MLYSIELNSKNWNFYYQNLEKYPKKQLNKVHMQKLLCELSN